MIDWHEPFTQAANNDLAKGRVEWFGDGELNASYNCIDRKGSYSWTQLISLNCFSHYFLLRVFCHQSEQEMFLTSKTPDLWPTRDNNRILKHILETIYKTLKNEKGSSSLYMGRWWNRRFGDNYLRRVPQASLKIFKRAQAGKYCCGWAGRHLLTLLYYSWDFSALDRKF